MITMKYLVFLCLICFTTTNSAFKLRSKREVEILEPTTKPQISVPKENKEKQIPDQNKWRPQNGFNNGDRLGNEGQNNWFKNQDERWNDKLKKTDRNKLENNGGRGGFNQGDWNSGRRTIANQQGGRGEGFNQNGRRENENQQGYNNNWNNGRLGGNPSNWNTGRNQHGPNVEGNVNNGDFNRRPSNSNNGNHLQNEEDNWARPGRRPNGGKWQRGNNKWRDQDDLSEERRDIPSRFNTNNPPRDNFWRKQGNGWVERRRDGSFNNPSVTEKPITHPLPNNIPPSEKPISNDIPSSVNKPDLNILPSTAKPITNNNDILISPPTQNDASIPVTPK